MKLLALFSTIGLALLSMSGPTVAAPTGAQPDVVPNQYIVTLKPTTNLAQFSRALLSEMSRERESATATDGVMPTLGHQVTIGSSFKAVVGVLTEDMVRKLKANGQVASVEPDHIVRAFETTQINPPSWGLARISRRTGNQGSYSFPDKQGDGVDVYVLDTGIEPNHPEFRGFGQPRSFAPFRSEAQWTPNDEHGHGTHVAGTIAGTRYGVAKRARVHGVKVLEKDGTGSTSGTIRAMEWVAREIRRVGKTAVCNMSYGVGYRNSPDLNAQEKAVAALFEAGCVVVKAAGNESQDACNVTPARTRQGLTVAGLAADGQSIDTSYSNFGRCVNIVAPGSSISSAWINNSYKVASGTSMAAPHVAGAAALILGQEPWLKPQEVVDRILSRASQGVITSGLNGTPNRVVYVGQ
ncbi:peptidase S8/S53 domain-containing protein [Catenaria anguillulae PL171]|uniref:Peptidase S8/S53 domain-containing protein n=1 Tax=Catenaria anguillulae PL171 TaxID=765915 RepID=A0A1Y2HF47_9FUNG|nr:peptidase S8/S53 domain-containing protein [Catenaria anguillulae PL171]